MVQIFGVDIKAIVGSAFKANLDTGTYIKVVNGARDPAALTAGPATTETSYSFDGLISDYTEQQMSGTLIQKGDRKVLLIAASYDADGSLAPNPNDKITIQGKTYRVINTKVDPAGATYECQVRH